MHKNPFSPSFSIRPERFYGRSAELQMMESAVANPDSPDRFLFVTGTRGVGKTSLLHQFALIAQSQRWAVLETTYQDAIEALRSFAGVNAASQSSVSIAPSVSAAGVSASVFEATHSKSKPEGIHLAAPFVAALRKATLKRGLFIAIDEVQKIREADMEEICHAVQAAKTEGLPVVLVIAGLPNSYARLRAFKGCTFIQRMRRYRLGTLGIQETNGFLKTMFALVPELELTTGQREELAGFSAGHPYLLQLLGSSIYDIVGESVDWKPAGPLQLPEAAIREAEHRAIDDYQRNVLLNLLVDVKNGTREYIKAMCEVCDSESTASTAEIAGRLGKSLQECSPTRARVIDLQLAEPIERGKLRFSIPYLPLAFAEPDERATTDSTDRWAPRALPF